MPTDETASCAALVRARSFLFVPGDRPDRFGKALATAADFVVIDLEDAVAEARKDDARVAIRSLDVGSGVEQVLVRCNAAGAKGFEADIEACLAAGVGAVMLPKTEGSGDVDQVVASAPAMRVVASIESARGYDRCREIAAHDHVDRPAFGPIDFRLDLGTQADGVELAFARSGIVLNSRLASIAPPIEGVTASYNDAEPPQHEIRTPRAFGFGGKLAIHPLQVGAINKGFSPAEAEIAWARRIVAAADAAGCDIGSIFSDGEMVDRPIVLRATHILRQSEEIL